MSLDRLDDFIRDSFPDREIGSARVDRVMASVLANIDAPPPRQGFLDRFRDLLAAPMSQYAMAWGVAAMLGVVVGNLLAPPPVPTQVSSLLVSSSLPYLGY